MKKLFRLFTLTIFLLTTTKVKTQTYATTYHQLFDTILDNFGNKYTLNDMSIDNARPFQSISSTNSLPIATCTAGYFVLHYGGGTIFTVTAAQNALCQIFTDLSNFISSPLTSTGAKVHIYCGNTGAQGMGVSYYALPYGGTATSPGLTSSQLHKTILSGIDAYANMPITIFGTPPGSPGSAIFYHASIHANPSYNWNFTCTTTTIASNEYDFYTVMLHEATHLLGFMSLIGSNGNSVFNTNWGNYYTPYDAHLSTSSVTSLPLLTPTTACGLSYTASTTLVNPNSCTGGSTPPDYTDCNTALYYMSNTQTTTVYRPNCWEGGSSFCHFEDMCSGPNFTTTCSGNPANWNNLYFVMSNSAAGMGSCYIKRYLKEQEKSVLCDLGYTVSSTYFCNLSGAKIDGSSASHTYSSNCSGPGVWANHDGINSSGFIFTAVSSVTNAIPISISNSIIANDSPNTTTISCLDVVFNNATCTISSGSIIVTTASGFSGLVMLKYCPQTSGGVLGLPAFIYVYFLEPGCTPNTCDLITNGNFEVHTGTVNCGEMNALGVPSPTPECWSAVNYPSPDLFVRNCTYTAASNPNFFNVGSASVTPVGPIVLDTYNGAANGNNSFMGFQTFTPLGPHESPLTTVSTPLTHNQTYLASMWVYNPISVYNTLPLAQHPGVATRITLYSLQNAASFSQNTLVNFTVNPTGLWTPVTQTFVFAPTNSHNVVGVQGDLVYGPNTYSIINSYAYVDDISILPWPTPTFVIPNAQSCGGNSTFTNLAQYASTLFPGSFSGPGVSTVNIGGNIQYNFSVSPTTPSIYPIAFTYSTSTCTYTLWQNISVAPIPTLSISGATNVCSNLGNNSTTLTVSCTGCATGSFTGFYWSPAGASGTSIVVTPTVSTIYTVMPMGNLCVSQQTYAVAVNSACCTQSITAMSTYSSSGSATLSTGAFNWDYTVANGDYITLLGTEYLFSTNVKLIVANGGTLRIRGAHLYSCNSDLWNGIEVKDGGKVEFMQYSSRDNLIEDAINAVSHVSSSGYDQYTALSIKNTTFNKNYIDINIANYTPTITSYPFTVEDCIFTCRTLPFNSSQWPQTGTVSAATTVTADLRYVNTSSTPTTGLSSPFLNQSGFNITTLKNPYSNQSSQIAIMLNGVGTSISTTMYGISIGTGTVASSFNVFDDHKFGVFGINSNITLRNNVFQNTTGGGMTHLDIGGGQVKIPGAAVSSYITNYMNSELDMGATSINTGNRFWNCHRAVTASNVYLTDIEYSLFRSTQSSTNTGVQPGYSAIFLGSNRFAYNIKHNEFTNINNGVNVSVSSGPFAALGGSSTVNGTYAGCIRVSYNSLSNGTTTNAYMNNAITITSPLTNTFTIPSASVNPFIYGVAVDHNTLTSVYRGILLNGNAALYPSAINENVISLSNDPNNFLQYGINVTNTQGKNAVNENKLSATSTTNTNQALIYGADNMGVNSPSISCNTATNCNKGFEFVGANGTPTNPVCALWAGNEMKTLSKGVFLTVGSGSVGGIIGPQGITGHPSDNVWTGSVTNGAYTDNSVAQLSPLTTKSVSPYTIPSPNGSGTNAAQYYNAVGAIFTNGGTGTYDCGDFVSARTVTLSPSFSTNTQRFLYKNLLYRHLYFNDSIRATLSGLNNFYNDHADSSVAVFVNIEQALYDGDLDGAEALTSGFTSENDAETTYKSFYVLYRKYAENNFEFTDSGDSTDLYVLANTCPETYGTAVYQARSLYNLVFKNAFDFYSDCALNSRLNGSFSEQNRRMDAKWDIDIFPNPASDNISIVSSQKVIDIEITIRDLSGRVLMTKGLQIQNFFAKLDLALINGTYFVTINSDSEKPISKKLVIMK